MAGRSVLRVVAAVLCRGGRILLAERPAGKELAGWREFPGGKCEAGEDDVTALRRELREELGIVAEAAEPFLSVIQPRAERVLHLSVYRVARWQGEPRPLEGQTLHWEATVGANPALLAPADQLVLAALVAAAAGEDFPSPASLPRSG